MKGSKKNILFITDDQHRFDFFTGGAVPGLHTPNIDSIRQQGCFLPNAYATHPVCIPARFTWAHGLRASQAGMTGGNDRSWPPPGRFPTVAQKLQEAGYHTALIGKLHTEAGLYHHDLTQHREHTRQRGFNDVVEVCGKMLAWWFECDWTNHLKKRGLLEDYYKMYRPIGDIFAYNTPRPIAFPPEDTMDGFIGEKAREWLESYKGDKPFYLHASFCGPHFPVDPARAYFERFSPEDMPAPEGVEDAEEIRRWQSIRAAYCGLIAQIDDEIGQILEILRRKGLEHETLVVFCTDHGDMLGHKGKGHKNRPEDTSSRTPLFISCPGSIPSGVVRSGLIEAVDLPATFLAWAGMNPDEALPSTPGRSILPHLAGETVDHREYTFTESARWRMCCDEHFKYVRWDCGDEELYARDGSDPWEFENRASDEDYRGPLGKLRDHMLDTFLLTENARELGTEPPMDHWLERRLAAQHG